MHFSIYEEKILNKLLACGIDSKDKARLKYGFYLFLDSLKKGILVYSLSFFLGVILETFLVHFSFIFVRLVSYGWHSSSRIGCIIGSIIIFTFSPYLFSTIVINKNIFLIITLILLSLLVYIGPVGTKISKISVNKGIILHNKLKKRVIFIMILALVIPIYYYKYVILGVILQLITLFIQNIKNEVIQND